MPSRSKAYWENQKAIAQKMMGKIWPKIMKARMELNEVVKQHSEYQLQVTEAERYLVEVIVLKPAASSKVKNTHWMKKIQTLSQKDRDYLVKVLEGRQANGSL